MAEFLPLCDVLFTVISLAGYFCDVIFDLVMAWALAASGITAMSIATIALVAFSLITSQIVSLRWYLNTRAQRQTECPKEKTLYRTMTVYLAVGLHVFQCGVLWRYAKLFIPVDLRHVKHEVRDLCMLRLMHAFLEAAPMLLLQVYLLVCPPTDMPHSKPFYDLNVVSASLSLFSVCWALASFSKNVRLQNVHRLVLTWLGVIFQFLWRLGTVSARVTALTMYAALYGHWIFLVIGLHWFCMFLWLISPKNVFHGERISKPRKAYLSALIAFVYVFAYVNLQEVNHRQKMVTFYVVMLLENALLVTAWLAGNWYDKPDDWYIIPMLVFGLFAVGLVFMLLYYRYFHVRRLGYEAGGRLPPINTNNNYCVSCNGVCECDENQQQPAINSKFDDILHDNKYDIPPAENKASGVPASAQTRHHRFHQHSIPGVFNCRFTNPVMSNVATKRKKKKPTTFVPPPTMSCLTQQNLAGPTPIAFWRRPLPNNPHNHQGGSSENEGSSVGSRVNIHQKLQEKKQKQLAELKIIEEEIKQGKLGGPTTNPATDDITIFNSLPRQPIPIAKKHIEPICWPPPSPDLADLSSNTNEINNIVYNKNINEYNLINNSNKLINYKQNFKNNINNNLNDLNSSVSNNTNRMVAAASPPSVVNINKNSEFNDLNGCGLSPIIGSDDSCNSSSLQRNQMKQLPKKANNAAATGRLLRESPRLHCTPNNVIQGFLNRQSPRNRDIILNSNEQLRSYEQMEHRNSGSRIVDFHQNAPNITASHSNDSIYNLRLYNNENNLGNSSRVILCTNYNQQMSSSPSNINNRSNSLNVDEVSEHRLSPRDIANLNKQHSSRFSAPPYHIVPPPKTKQVNHPLIRNANNRSKTPEILLAPHYLDNSRIYYDWNNSCGNPGPFPNTNVYRIHDQHLILNNDDNNSTLRMQTRDHRNNLDCEPNSVSDNEQQPHQMDPQHYGREEMHEDMDDDQSNYKAYQRAAAAHAAIYPSDIDSQISLPRSYTLPREFKYYRRNHHHRVRKNTRNDHFIASTNSSDGDVDSGDDNDTDDSVMAAVKTTNLPGGQTNNLGNTSNLTNVNNGVRNKVALRRPYAYRNQVKHETKL